MKLDWIEDFLALVDAGSFSKAAVLRNITQPAFSRRIQMFEEWLGVVLVNRHARRLELTATATRFESVFRRVVEDSYELRAKMRADAHAGSRVTLTTQHTLMMTHLPTLLHYFEKYSERPTCRIRTGNLEDCVAQLMRGEADLLLGFSVENESLREFTTGAFERIDLDAEALIPVSAPDARGEPRFDVVNTHTLKLLHYPEESFLGRAVRRLCLPTVMLDHGLDIVCESAFSVGLQRMALAGMGIAWLPRSLVLEALASGSLIALDEYLPSPRLTIAVYRARGQSPHVVDTIWSLLANARSPFATSIAVGCDSLPATR